MDDSRIASTMHLLQRLQAGDPAVEAKLFALLYDDLHDRAEQMMRRQPPDHTLQPTALVNEAWLKLRGHDDRADLSRSHFLRLTSRAMRSVLVDHARTRMTDKRGGGVEKQCLDEEHAGLDAPDETLLSVDEALTSLQGIDADLARVAELRLFGGLEHQEIAEMLGVSTRTVERAWSAARAWLQNNLDAPTTRPPAPA